MVEEAFKKKIVFPEYSQLQTRLNSFTNTHRSSVIYGLKKYYAEAGFFYTGKNDETICYYCGGGLKDWSVADDPWEEHARWFGGCPFVIINKGQYFVDKHRRSCNPVETTYNRCIPIENITDKPEENRKIVKECIVCLTNERSVLFLPCKHCCTCTTCGLMFDNCVYCRARITSLMKIYLV
jgi:hypothetical protein